jgi:HK97 family phage major capsid protein
MLDLKALREEFTKLHGETEALVKKAADEKRDPTADEQKVLDANFAALDRLKKTEERFTKLASTAFASKEPTVDSGSVIPGKEQADMLEPKGADVQVYSDIRVFENAYEKDKVVRARFNQYANEWLKTGRVGREFATITTTTDSGIMLPVSVAAPAVPTAPNTFRQALQVWGMSALQTPTTEQINLPVATPAAGGVVAENASTETENEPALTGSITLKVQTIQSGSSWFSNQQILAVNFDLFSELLPSLNYAKELAMESQYMSNIASDASITNIVNTTTVSGFVYNDLVNLNRALPKRYGFMKVIVLNKAAYIAAEKLVTTTGFPILNQDAQNSELKRFNGTPVLWTDYLSGFGANNIVGFVMSLIGYRLRDCAQVQVQRYTQYPSRPAQTGYNLYGYHAQGYDPAAMATFKCPAS